MQFFDCMAFFLLQKMTEFDVLVSSLTYILLLDFYGGGYNEKDTIDYMHKRSTSMRKHGKKIAGLVAAGVIGVGIVFAEAAAMPATEVRADEISLQSTDKMHPTLLAYNKRYKFDIGYDDRYYCFFNTDSSSTPYVFEFWNEKDSGVNPAIFTVDEMDVDTDNKQNVVFAEVGRNNNYRTTVNNLKPNCKYMLEIDAWGYGSKIVDVKISHTNTVNIKGVKLNRTTANMTKGSSLKLTATVSPSNASNKSVTWTSSNKSVATVDAKGNVKAVNPGTATITVKTNDGGKTATCKITVPNVWKRLWGQGRYDTMKVIVNEGFKGTGGTVIVATGSNFKDALAASGLAGLENAPVVLTDGNALSGQAKEVLNRIKPKKIYVAGGPAAVSDKVVSAIKSTTKIAPQRLYGQNSTETSAKLALAGKGKWKDATAIIATNKSFKDALSVAPIAYVKKYPILLADNGTSLSKPVLNALKSLGVKNVIIVGGKAAVTANVEKQITSAGIKIKTRLWGSNAVETSKKIAEWGINNGMSANNMGVATSQNFPDALAGAAMCGKNGSVLVLADDKAGLNATFPKAYKTKINQGYVFGGEFAVGKKTLTTLENSARQ